MAPKDAALAEAWLRYMVARDEAEPDGKWQGMRALRSVLNELDELRARVGDECERSHANTPPDPDEDAPPIGTPRFHAQHSKR